MEPDVLELARELVQINSITPTAVSRQAKQGGERKLAEWLQNYFSDRGFAAELDWVTQNRPNLIVTAAGFDPKRPTVAFEAHMDTVDVVDMTIDPFAAEVRDGFLWGRGACDVKGPMAAMITAMMDWYGTERRHSFNLVFVGTMGEEAGTLGARHIAKSGRRFDLALVGEPTRLQPVVGHKGLWRFFVETTGQAAHSAMPDQGVNAIQKMIPILNTFIYRLCPDFERLDENTMSLTMLHGGSVINVIPERCRVYFDARFGPNTDIAGFEDKIIRELERIARENAHTEVTFHEIQRNPAFRTNERSTLLGLLEIALEEAGVESQRRIEPWYSDAGFISSAGMDTVIWGPGDIRDAHTAAEKISVDQLKKAVQVLKGFLHHCEDYYGGK